MLKTALGVKPNELDNRANQVFDWYDPEENLADSDKYMTKDVTLFCPEKQRRDLEVRDILQKRKIVQTKVKVLK